MHTSHFRTVGGSEGQALSGFEILHFTTFLPSGPFANFIGGGGGQMHLVAVEGHCLAQCRSTNPPPWGYEPLYNSGPHEEGMF